MKRETVITAFLSGALALLIGLGAVGCVISAFDLTIQNLPGIVLACVAAAGFCAAMFSLKWGGLGVLAALTLFFLFLWRKTDGLEQLFCLLQRVTHLYNNAYGWGPGRIISPDGAIVAHTSETYKPANYEIDLNEKIRIKWLAMGDAMSHAKAVYRYQKHEI